MIRWLFDHFPELGVMSSVVEEATASGDMDILRYFLENDESVDRRSEPDSERGQYRLVCWGHLDMAKAAEAGHSDVVEWLQNTEEQDVRDIVATMRAAVTNGDVELVALVQRITGAAPPHGLLAAASHGHVMLLESMAEQYAIGANITLGSLVKAAENGLLHVVRWLIERDWNDEELDSDSDTDDWDDYGYGWGGRRQVSTRPTHCTNVGGEACLAIHAAAINGHLEVAKYIRARIDTFEQRRRLGENHNTAKVSGKTLSLAAKRGHIDVVKWLVDEFSVNSSIDLFRGDFGAEGEASTAMDLAATQGHLEIVQYLHEVAKSFKATIKRTRKRSLDTLYAFFDDDDDKPRKLPTTAPPKCTAEAMNGAAAHGHLEIVRWLHDNRTEGCTAAAMDLASSNGHLEVVQWLHENRSEGCTMKAMNYAASGGHLDAVKWLHEHRSEGCTTKAMDGAASGGHLDVVKWLHENRPEGCTTGAMDGAAACGALDTVKWLNQNRAEGCTSSAMDKAARNGHIRVIRWLHEHRSEGCTVAALTNEL